MSITTAVILVGGKGTRLGSLTAQKPKPLVEVGGIPILEHQLRLLERYGVDKVFLLANHLSDRVVDFVHQRNGKSKVHIHVESKPLGTAGGLKEIEELLPKEFLLLYGDVMLDMALDRLVAFHTSKNADATLVVHPNDHPYDSDLAACDEEGKITDWFAKPQPEGKWLRNLVNAGLYVLNKAILSEIPQNQALDFGKDLFPGWATSKNLYGYITPEYLKDMGTPDRLEKVTRDYLSGRIQRSNLEHPHSAIFLDRDGVINEEVDLIHRPEDLVLLPEATSAIAKINRSEYLALVATNQSVVARNLTDIKGLRVIFNKMETDLGKGRAYLDHIYYCPHHPHGGFPGENPEYKIECDCRKPKPGMLLQAAKDWNIDLSRSWFIGDSDRDILAGKAAGVQTVAVRTGKGVKDSTQRPDYFFEHIGEAVDFILNDPFLEYCQEITRKISKMSPLGDRMIISIAGNSRSGKSILAARLAKLLKDQGEEIVQIHLDDWITPISERQSTDTVWERYQLDKIREDFNLLLQGKAVQLFPYHSLSMERSKVQASYFIPRKAVVIVDGVVACHPRLIPGEVRSFKVFCTVDESLRAERLKKFYQWKGLGSEEIAQKLAGRQKDEYYLVEQTAAYADWVVQLN